MKIIISGIIFIFAFILIIYIAWEPYFFDKKIRNNINNFDASMNNYIFTVNNSRQHIVERLYLHNISDCLEYFFDPETLTICFKDHGLKATYQLEFFPVTNEYMYLLISKTSLLPSNSMVGLKINNFFINKLDAHPVDYITFKRTIYQIPKSL